MKIVRKIGKAVKEIGKAIAKKPLEVILATTLSLTLVACSKHKKPYINQSPVFITETIPDAKENSNYSEFIQATDPENDPIIYSITGGTADVFLAINPITGELTNDTAITDVESGINYTLTVKAEDDKGNSTENVFLLYVINTANLSGKIVSALDTTTNIQGAKVYIGTNEATTNASGNWSLNDIVDGEYNVRIEDGTGTEANFVTYNIGILPVNKTNENANQLDNLDFALKPNSHNDFVYETILIGTGLRTEGPEKFHTIIYTRDLNGGSDMPASVVNAVKSYTINERSQFSRKNYVDADITVNNIDLPTVPSINNTVVYWNSGVAGGGAGIWLDGNEIIASSIRLSPDLGSAPNIESIILTEMIRILTDGGDDSALNTPHAYMGPPQTTVLNLPDILDSTLSYDPVYKRPWENTDERSADNYDVNPSGYLIRPR